MKKAKKKVTRKPKSIAHGTKDNVVAAVEFVLGADDTVSVRTVSRKDCPPTTAANAALAADLLFREAQRNGAVAVKIGDRVVLAERA